MRRCFCVDRPVRRVSGGRLVLSEVHAIPVVPERSTEVVQYRPGFVADGAADAILASEGRHGRRGTWDGENDGDDPEGQHHGVSHAGLTIEEQYRVQHHGLVTSPVIVRRFGPSLLIAVSYQARRAPCEPR